MLQVCGHIKHVVVVVLSLCLLQLLSMFPHTHFSPVCDFLAIAFTAKTGLLKCCLYNNNTVRIHMCDGCKISVVCHKLWSIS